MSIESYLQEIHEEFNVEKIPFYNKKEKKIKFKYEPNIDLIFIFPRPIPEKKRGIIISESYRKYHRDEFGIILAKGKGYYHKNGKFVSTDEVEIGDLVIYDKTVPSKTDVEALDGKEYEIKVVGILDIKLIVKGDK